MNTNAFLLMFSSLLPNSSWTIRVLNYNDLVTGTTTLATYIFSNTVVHCKRVVVVLHQHQ